MIPVLLLALAASQADPGRVVAGATVGGSPQHGLALRGSLDYGAVPHFSVTGELGNVPGEAAAAMGLGLLAAPLDGQWWRVGVVVIPELLLPVTLPVGDERFALGRAAEPLPGLQTGVLDSTLALRSGLRVNWLAFWGLTVSARADWSQPLDGQRGWAEIGAGLSARL
ncbi:MAG: hypothetical protein ABIO70_34930 [Pseudomonadota bacterium]